MLRSFYKLFVPGQICQRIQSPRCNKKIIIVQFKQNRGYSQKYFLRNISGNNMILLLGSMGGGVVLNGHRSLSNLTLCQRRDLGFTGSWIEHNPSPGNLSQAWWTCLCLLIEFIITHTYVQKCLTKTKLGSAIYYSYFFKSGYSSSILRNDPFTRFTLRSRFIQHTKLTETGHSMLPQNQPQWLCKISSRWE